ncbi:MAG: hypothetical protein KF754_12875 [Planctomycetes bacterium]|nr:hypothetical protein [Planctomycetota bacterium]
MRFSRMMKVAIVGVVLAIAATPSGHGQARQEGGIRQDFAWQVEPHQYLYFAPVESKLLDAAGSPTPEVHFKPWHFFGYELDQFGLRAGSVQPLGLQEVLAHTAAYMPGSKFKVGGDWKRNLDFPHIVGMPGLGLSGECLFARMEDYRGKRCSVVTGTWQFRALAKVGSADNPAAVSNWTTFTVNTTCWFDNQARIARGLRFVLAAELKGADAASTTYQWAGEWRLADQSDSRDRDALNERIAGAIAKGVDALFAQQKEGLWPFYHHRRGGTALVLHALLASDVKPDDPRIVRGFEAMANEPMETTYAASISLMAIEAKYTDAEERRHYVVGGDELPPFKRNLSAADRAEMKRIVDWLVDNRNADNPLWTYNKERGAGGGKWCFSTTHYVLMGFAAAARCGIALPKGITKSVSSYLLKYQQKEGPKIKRVIAAKENAKGVPAFARASKQGDSRGWEYMTWGLWDEKTWTGAPYGSMTCAGLITQMLCVEWGMGLQGKGLEAEFGTKAEQTAWNLLMQNSLEGGLCWLEYFFSVTRNPWRSQFHEYFYYIYSLERVAMMAGLRYIGEHNWYFEGACPLLALQRDDGQWGEGIVETSFALLFLKKGTVPLRSRVVTGEGG